ncbi:MAG: hypothetical protein QNI84_13355 [Henriciella sp.]|nr:hypothetical protein [Henriciella sp.]
MARSPRQAPRKPAGKKSKAAQQVAQVLRMGERPPAPLSLLRDRAIEEWVRVTNAMPSDWFTDETLALLESYCNHVANADSWVRLIQGFDVNWVNDPETGEAALARYEKFQKNFERETRAASSLATRMRMTQQAKYTTKSAGTSAKGRAPGGRKPWEQGAITNGGATHDSTGEE